MAHISDDKMTKSQQLYTNDHTFNYDFGVVTAAWLKKFPDPTLKQVKSVETVARVLDPERQELRIRRLFYCVFPLPAFVESIIGEKASVICVEEAHWDMRRKHLTIHGRNESLRGLICIDEVCEYTEVQPGQTLYTQSASVRYRKGVISGFLAPVAREICGQFCLRNCSKGTEAMAKRAQAEATGVQYPLADSESGAGRFALAAAAPAASTMQPTLLNVGALVCAAAGFVAMSRLRREE